MAEKVKILNCCCHGNHDCLNRLLRPLAFFSLMAILNSKKSLIFMTLMYHLFCATCLNFSWTDIQIIIVSLIYRIQCY